MSSIERMYEVLNQWELEAEACKTESYASKPYYDGQKQAYHYVKVLMTEALFVDELKSITE